MDFTEIYKQTASLVSFSPGTHFLLTAVQDRLIVRRSDSFQIARTWLVDSTPSPTSAALSSATAAGPSSLRDRSGDTASGAWITHAGWSCDSEYVLGACAKSGVVSVFKLRDETWSARIEAGSEGLVKAEWAPDGRTVLCFSEWGVSHCMQLLLARITRLSLEQSAFAAASDNVVACDRRRHIRPVPHPPGSRYVPSPHFTIPSAHKETLEHGCRIRIPARLALLRTRGAPQVQGHPWRVRRARSIPPRQGASPVNPCAHARFYDMTCYVPRAHRWSRRDSPF